MEIHTLLLLLLLASLPLLLLLRCKSKRNQEISRRRPPGPWGLPFVGSIHHLLTSQPHAVLRALAKKHGPVMYLRLGQVDTVVVSSPAAAREVLHANDVAFASRPSLLGPGIVSYGYIDIAFSPYGAYWRTLRRLCTLELLGARKVRRFAPIRDRETLSLVDEIRAAGSGVDGSRPVNLTKLLMSCTNRITLEATFGDCCSGEHQEQFFSAMEVLIRNSSGFCVVDLFPSLWFMDVVTGMRSRLLQVRRKFDTVLDMVISESEARQKENKATATVGGEDDQKEEDLLSVLLRTRDEGELEFPFHTTNIKAIILDLFMAGTETTSSTIEWVMVELMRNPAVMTKVQAEVKQELHGKDPRDHGSHMDNLHYMKMVIKETMRLHPPLPFLLPRVCQKTCDVCGFNVVEGSRVIVNAWAIATSSDYWDDAEAFKPERFENSDVDYNGSHYEYLPFGSGRRMCPGIGFGLASLELIVARLIYYFDWSLPAGMRPEELDMDVIVGAAARRKDKLYLVASHKVPSQI